MSRGFGSVNDRFGSLIAFGLIALFVVQSAARLAFLLAGGGQRQVAAVHAFNLAALVAFAIASLAFTQRRPVLRLFAALLLAGAGMLLTVFDIASLIAWSFNQRVQPLGILPIFYCNAESVVACGRVYPLYSLLIGAVFLGWAGLIYRAGNGLYTQSAALLKWLPVGKIVSATLILWAVCWLLLFGDMAGREPLFRFLKATQFGAEPRELVAMPRPDFKVAASPAVKPRPLVLIVVDSLRADAVELSRDGASDTPFLRSLYAKGELRDLGPSVATCAASYCGIIGLLSSSDWATLQQGPPLMLPDVLAANGYQSHYLLSGPHKRVLNLAALYGPNVTTMLDDSSADSSGLIDDREQVRRLQNIALPDPARSFIFVHLMSAHGAGLWFGDQVGKQSYAERYRQKVRQADAIIAQLFATLKARGLLDDAIILITADHGERLTGEPGHGGEPDLDTALVPMLVFDQRGQWPVIRDGRIASAADVAPTMLAAAGIDIPRQWQGKPLQLPQGRPSAPIDGKGVSGFVGLKNGKLAMVRCRIGKAKFEPDDLELFALWSRGWKKRSDALACPNHVQP